jgi:hypothetical protein
MYYDFCVESRDWDYIFSGRVPEILRRYRFLKEYGITSFGKHYDELPAYWVDALEIMDTNYNMAIEWQRKSLT